MFTFRALLSPPPCSYRGGASWEGMTWPFTGTFQLSLREPRVFDSVRVMLGQGIVHGYGATLHEALTSQTRREPYRPVLPCDCSLARSLALKRSPSLPLSTTHASGSDAKERPCMLRTKRYFGIDKDGEAETPKDGGLSSTVEKNGFTCVPLDPRTSFSLVYSREKSATFVQSVRYLFGRPSFHYGGRFMDYREA